ncbi:sigma-54 interaction domain-containing protein [Alteromonas lipolytica]|nr:sigma-54-dependent Fis family transcriptional regulator [Alteromonas lipolytica]GGF62194.1 sigma-54-dependent Fis family transcriptional regulator [Alteromonas lipolytica]
MNASLIQSMINAIDKPAIFITHDYVIQAVNDAYRETYDIEVIVGTSTCHAISHRSDAPCDKHGEDCPLSQCQKTQRPSSVVHIHNTNDGKSYCDILMKPVRDEDGMTIGFLEILDRISYAAADSQRNKMIGSSDAFKQMLNRINRAAQSEIAVLLQGETGAGKELVAQAVHESSRRKEKPFVVIECTGLNESLFESELFGYEKGAFTGATNSKKGLIEVANGGTVFFDEIGDVPLNMQVKLLRLLETQCYRPVGGLKQKKADFRLVCASHKNLLNMVEKGEFRQDLYFRIAGFPIYLPALRERKEDIPLLCRHFLVTGEHRHKHFSEQALQTLQNYAFPGNIRELKSIVEQSALMSNDDDIMVSDLPPQILGMRSSESEAIPDEVMPLEQAEQAYLEKICKHFEGSPDELANKLDVSTRTLYRKLQRYNIKLKSS